MFLKLFSLSIFLITATNQENVDSDISIDENGYILYCPCMGRFGNQADHLLGALGFAKVVNRTLVLPPWIEYKKGATRSTQIKFSKYFKVAPLQDFHRCITMDTFMSKLANTIWPINKRTSFCYMERKSLSGSEIKGCHAKDGNPFGPFWDTFNIDFTASEFFGPLHYDVHHSSMAEEWSEKYPSTNWPVLAFTGAPASFPVQEENLALQQHLHWSDEVSKKAAEFIKTELPKGAFIGIHLRNGIDWVRACEHIKDSTNLFSSAQCLGYRNEKGELTMDMCFPTRDIVVRLLKRQIKKIKTQNPTNEIRSVFVASDSDHMAEYLTEAMSRMKVTVHTTAGNDPHLDLAVLGLSNHFIGNCVSSFSAFVKRHRDVRGLPSSFWAFPKEKSHSGASGNASKRKANDEL